MAATNYTPISLYYSLTATNTPSAGNLVYGELAINIADGKLFYKNPSNVVTLLASSAGVVPSPFTANGVVYASSTSALTTGSALTFNGTNLVTTGSATGTAFIPSGSTVPTNGMYLPSTNTVAWSTNTTEVMRLDSSGNLGLGVTPSAWIGSWKVLQLPGVSLSSSSIIGIVGQNWYINSSGADTYITTGAASVYKQTAATHTWLVAPSGTGGTTIPFNTVMTLDVSGNLGLGVTPSAWGSGYKALQINNGGLVTNVGGTFIAVTANAYWDGTNYRYVSTAAASLYRQNNGAHDWQIAPSGTAGNAITFTQAMTLDASGALLVGATSFAGAENSNSVQIGSGANPGTVWVNHLTGTTSSSRYANFAYAGTEIGSITQSGTTAVLYNLTSDQRLKENIQDAKPAADLIDAIQVRQFDWKSDGSHQRYGFVAQELVTVAPEAVHQPADPDEMMAVDYSKLVPMLVKEIQSLRIRIAQLEAK
jgi:hypothetical protein